MGKETVVVKDSPGFITSRVNAMIGNEAFLMLQEGVATRARTSTRRSSSASTIPMGPFELVDLVGLDTRLAVLEFLHRSLGEKYRPAPLLVQHVKAGRLGRKVGRGVYDYGGAVLSAGYRATCGSPSTGRVATLTVNRPEVRNALDSETVEEFHRALDEVARGPGVTVLIVTGAGDKAFVSGRRHQRHPRAAARRRAGLDQLAPDVRGRGARGGDDRGRQRLRPGRRLRAGPGLRPPHRVRAARSSACPSPPSASSPARAAPSACPASWAWAAPRR